MKQILIFILIFSSACSQVKPLQKAETSLSTKQKVSPIVVQKLTIKPGEVTKLKFSFPVDITKINCSEKDITVFREEDHYSAFVVESYFSNFKPFNCTANNIKIAEYQVLPKEFPSETLKVDMKRVVLSKADQKRVQTEQIFLNSVYRASPQNPMFSEAFELPIDSEITSIYGSRRVFNKKKQTQHLGTDFRAPVGEPIKAANAGRVVVARELFFTGNTVTIDHGLGIFTIYGHLSKLNAVEGEMAPQGAIIGLSGATGRVTGPHLHWGVKIEGEFIDGHSLVNSSK
ncbi:MAG: hypothetical protein COW00_08705 [Bdellovibrio sp. CG12_big_fil_rev_8_21_14_0_65_39_13]|nr:MAG: hypothetical protein COW78_08775 [Bdellovibrio sp. CG22_combo_CG10-13_8_21_14_all_39_27]PIQ59703.1 MAG: hypothetical protein COW00_08705 [Bdellovibrio sp. CG12_big_fil_rev_8_21_14_0_65_39_13]PIR36266.1 MAG: hypothetical protein COV37_04680 [Bdellovibrio sp. CG11_big_fil_rev_8_21_14_0_20_39_38]PJB54649.1 MAG: hypothetical protein CO099_00365 [Bdellovibrio sp. CG_4_9_14_3_um_filter_39_7]